MSQKGYSYIRDRWRKQKPDCAICGDPIAYKKRWPHPLSLTVDHILPKVLYPNLIHVESNLQPAHFDCNTRKGHTDMWINIETGRYEEIEDDQDEEIPTVSSREV